MANDGGDCCWTCRFVGKWDIGMATTGHHPKNRGFDSWLGYWHHANGASFFLKIHKANFSLPPQPPFLFPPKHN